jgi:predicted dehydrogenase
MAAPRYKPARQPGDSRPLRVAFTGVAHWHAHNMYDHLVMETGVEIVGVSDTDRAIADRVARQLRCPVYYGAADLLARAEPELAFAHEVHADMPALASALIEAGVPFAMEKPVGLDSRTVEDLARRADAAGLYCDIPFVYRMSPWVEHALARAGEAARPRLNHAHFRLISGPPTRYVANGVDWMLDPKRAGGGCTVNLSVHFLDLFAFLAKEEVRVRDAAISYASYHLPVEDFSLITLESASGALASIETGYTQPQYGRARLVDFGCTMRTPTDYYQVGAFETMITDAKSFTTSYLGGSTINRTFYPQYARDVVARVVKGEPPLASLWDMVAAMRLIEAAYAKAR